MDDVISALRTDAENRANESGLRVSPRSSIPEKLSAPVAFLAEKYCFPFYPIVNFLYLKPR